MPKLKVAFNKSTNVATVLDASGSVPGGSVYVGQFDHPDLTYPDSLVIYHGVRDLLYKRSAADPSKAAMYPKNILNMQAVTIDFKGTPRLLFTTNLQRVISTIVGKDVVWEAVVAGGKAPLTYKWYWNDTLIDSSENPSAKTPRLVNHAVTVESEGNYRLEVTDANSTKITSRVSQLVVADPHADDPVVLTSIKATPATLSLSVAADAANGKAVTFAPLPAEATLGTLSIKTAPAGATATAIIAGNVLTVKPVAAGTTTVVVTNGTIDVTVNVTVAA